MLDNSRKHENTGKIKKLSYSQTFKVGDIVRQHCSLVNGFAVYEKDWDDAKIAEALGGGPYSPGNVAGVRKQLIGMLRTGSKTVEAATKERLVQVEDRLSALEDWATSRVKMPFDKDII